MPPDHPRGSHAFGTSKANSYSPPPPPKGLMLIAHFILIILKVTLKRKGKKKQPPKYSVFKNPMKFKKLQTVQKTKNHIYKTISFSWEHM